MFDLRGRASGRHSFDLQTVDSVVAASDQDLTSIEYKRRREHLAGQSVRAYWLARAHVQKLHGPIDVAASYQSQTTAVASTTR